VLVRVDEQHLVPPGARPLQPVQGCVQPGRLRRRGALDLDPEQLTEGPDDDGQLGEQFRPGAARL
jgi:hypothetical protein